MINEMFHLDSYGVIVVATAWESPYDDTGETHADQRGYLECRNSLAKPCRN